MTYEELKRIREGKGLSKEEFAKLLGVTAMVYSRYENRTLAIPDRVEKAVKEFISKAPDAAAVTEIEVKKNVRAAGRQLKEKVTNLVTSDEAAAAEIELKKNIRAAGRQIKETVADLAAEAASAVAEVVEAVTGDDVSTDAVPEAETEAAADAVPEAETEAAADAVPEAETEAAADAVPEPAKTSIMIQSELGGSITPEEILSRIPSDCDTVYVKTEENKAYWVKGNKSGSIDLW